MPHVTIVTPTKSLSEPNKGAGHSNGKSAPADSKKSVVTLRGGNQQKRWLVPDSWSSKSSMAGSGSSVSSRSTRISFKKGAAFSRGLLWQFIKELMVPRKCECCWRERERKRERVREGERKRELKIEKECVCERESEVVRGSVCVYRECEREKEYVWEREYV